MSDDADDEMQRDPTRAEVRAAVRRWAALLIEEDGSCASDILGAWSVPWNEYGDVAAKLCRAEVVRLIRDLRRKKP